MRKSLIIFLSCAIFITYALPAYAVADRCPRQQVKTDLKTKRYKPRLFHGTLKTINDYRNSHNVLAFAEEPIGVQTQYEFSLENIGDNRSCVMLDKVTAYYFSAPRIVMPKNFGRKSCQYKIILEHEKRHVKVFVDYFEQSEKDYAAFLGRIARNVPVSVPVRNGEEVAEMQLHIRDYFDEKFREQVAKSLEEMMTLQAKIDSPQEYTFTNRKIDRCEQQEEKERRQNKKTFDDHHLE